MKILHTSDLHIGKKLMGRERYKEYRAVLSEICRICKWESVELVLIAGDIYDNYLPSAEAEEIFYSGIKQISQVCAVLIIAGNHDDYLRLSAAASFAEDANVYIVGNGLTPINCAKRGRTYPVSSGCGWVIFQNSNGEKVYINTLPYPNEARFKEGKSEESFEEKMHRWINLGEAGKEHLKIPSVFLAHIFVAGGAVTESEREIDLGGTRLVAKNLLPDCNYCALGHLHKRQHLGNNIYYSGSPMQFSFDESNLEKSVNVFDLTERGVENLKKVNIESAVKLVRLQANGVEGGLNLLSEYKGYYVELTLNLTEPMTPTEIAALHSYENLILLKAEIKNLGKSIGVTSNKGKTSSQLFSDYYKSRYGAEVSKQLLALFLSLTEEE